MIDLLQGAKFFVLYFIWRVGRWFSKNKFSNFRKKNFRFILFNLIFLNFFYVITAPYTLKGSRKFQGFFLIRAVLLFMNLIAGS